MVTFLFNTVQSTSPNCGYRLFGCVESQWMMMLTALFPSVGDNLFSDILLFLIFSFTHIFSSPGERISCKF